MSIASVGQALTAYGAALRARQGCGRRRRPRTPRGFAGLVRAETGGRPRRPARRRGQGGRGALRPASLQDVVEAVTEAELSLQKMTAVRDRVISAYQEIMRMPI